MGGSDVLSRKPLARMETPRAGSRPWAVVLAGGEGVRCRPAVRQVCGDERPKQYAPLIGSRSLLRQTLDRAALLFPPERTIVVSLQRHSRYLAAEFRGAHGYRLLLQPEERGTGPGILVAAHWLAAREPEATLAVLPSDHLVIEEEAFMAHLAEVLGLVEREPAWLILLGARATDAEREYGWIEPGDPVEGSGLVVHRVRRFWEKPEEAQARTYLARGWLWNTLVFTARVATVMEAGRRYLPALHERFARMIAFEGTEHEVWAMRQAYALAPPSSFSRTILEPCPPFLAVSRLPALTWVDLGTPERVLAAQRLVQTMASARGTVPRPA